MEILGEGTDDNGWHRQLCLATADGFDGWSSGLTAASLLREEDRFALLLVGDAIGVDAAVIGDLADWCITHGLFWMSVWGPDCERVHDIFDEEEVMLALDTPVELRDGGDVMTSWHDDETLSEAFEFFWTSSFAADDRIWGPKHIVLVVGSRAWADEVRSLAANLPRS